MPVDNDWLIRKVRGSIKTFWTLLIRILDYSNWTLKETKIYISIIHSTYHIQFSYLPHINYSLLAWETKCQKIELLQKKAVRVVHSKSPIAHTNPLFKKMNLLRVSDLYTCNL